MSCSTNYVATEVTWKLNSTPEKIIVDRNDVFPDSLYRDSVEYYLLEVSNLNADSISIPLDNNGFLSVARVTTIGCNQDCGTVRIVDNYSTQSLLYHNDTGEFKLPSFQSDSSCINPEITWDINFGLYLDGKLVYETIEIKKDCY